MLLMDISKAYDSVSAVMMDLALDRIKIKGKLKKLIMYIFENRENRVIVNKDMTDSFDVEDGLDQGEVWSLILWRIFFDPLLCKLEKMKKDMSYKMKAEEIINIKMKCSRTLQYEVNHVAFMDDANLIAESKDQIIGLYGMCDSFFKMCDIRCNPNKYELLGINIEKEEAKEIILAGNKIEINTTIEGVRFLGVWINNKANKKSHVNNIKKLVSQALGVMRWKKMTA